MNRLVPRVLAALLVAAMVAPALTSPPTDGFPLSTYPMFAVDRGEITTTSTAVGHTRSGERVRLSPRLLAGTEEPILAVRTARVAVQAGEGDPWCREVADRVAADQNGTDDPIEWVEVVTETHDTVATLAERADPLEIRSHAVCPVPRT